jgi:hypothetical protein
MLMSLMVWPLPLLVAQEPSRAGSLATLFLIARLVFTVLYVLGRCVPETTKKNDSQADGDGVVHDGSTNSHNLAMMITMILKVHGQVRCQAAQGVCVGLPGSFWCCCRCGGVGHPCNPQ